MPDEALISQIENILAEVIELGGANERSQIVPNLTVQDANPAKTGFIIVSDDRDGDNIFAKKVGSVIYSNNDKVNVVFPRGGEAIAFQQGSQSSNSGIWEIVPSTSTDIFYDKGKVGIGTNTIPHGGVGWATLAIDGGDFTADGANIQLTTTTDDYPTMQIFAGTHDEVGINLDSYYENGYKSSTTDQNFQILATGGRLRFRYDSGVAAGAALSWNEGIALRTDGTVGIGTITPGAKLESVSSTGAQLRLSHTTASKFLDVTVDTNHDATFKPSSTGQIIFQPTTDSVDFLQILDANGGTPIFQADSTNENIAIGHTATTLGKLSVITDSNTKETFVIKQKSGQTALLTGWQDSAGTTIASMSIFGIFSTSTLSGTTGASIGGTSIDVQNRTATVGNYSGVRGKNANGDVLGAYQFVADSHVAGTGQLRMGTSSAGTYAEAMRIDSSGNVGIGVTAPSVPLDVKRTDASGTVLQLENTAGIASATFINGSSKSWAFGVLSGASGAFAITEIGVASQFFVAAGGNVGIGAAAPQTQLHLSDGGSLPVTNPPSTWPNSVLVANTSAAADQADLILIGGASGYGVIRFGDTANGSIGNITYNHNNDSMSFRTNAADRVLIDSSGYVGIGTTAPQGILHTYDTIGGFLIWEYDGLDATVRTVVPNGAGDCLYRLQVTWVFRNSAGVVVSGSIGVSNGGSTSPTVGTDTVRIRVNADGSIDVARTAGTNTIKVLLHLLWL